MNQINIEEVKRDIIVESSLSRIIQHMKNKNQTFAMISPFRGVASDASEEERKANDVENERKYAEMKRQLRDLNLGYIETIGGFEEAGIGEVTERSFFIPKITKQQAIEFGNMYNQDSILFADGDDFSEIGTNDNVGVGKVVRKFNRDKLVDSSPEHVKQFFSALAKGSHGYNPKSSGHKHKVNMRRVLDMHVTNPETGKRIKVASALKYDESHPAHQAAKALVDRETSKDDIKHRKFLFQLERRTPVGWLTEWRVATTGSEHELWFRIA